MIASTIRKKLALRAAYEEYAENKPISKNVWLELTLCDIDIRPLLRGKFDDPAFVASFEE